MRSLPAVRFALILSLGIWLGDKLGFMAQHLLWIAAAVVLLAAFLFCSSRWGSASLFVTVLTLGFYLSSVSRPQSNSMNFPPSTAAFWGGRILSEDYRTANRRVLVLRPDWSSLDGAKISPFPGRLRLICDTDRDSVRVGSQVVVLGKWSIYPPQKSQGNPDWQKIFLRRGIVGYLKPEVVQVTGQPGLQPLEKIREAIKDALTSALPPCQAGLVIGLVLGDKQALPEDVQDDFRSSGLYHLLTVSGMNVAYLGALFALILAPITHNLRIRRWLIIMGAWVYTLLTGSNPATVRATLMVTLLLMSSDIMRVPRPWNLWGSAALIILLFSPQQLFSPGFQLSFAATAGVLTAVDVRKSWQITALLAPARRQRLSFYFDKYLTSPLLVSICAVVFTAPILTAHFGSFAPVAVFMNLLAIPLAGGIFALAWIQILFHLITGMTIFLLAAALELGSRGLEHLASIGSDFSAFSHAVPGGLLAALVSLIVLLGVLLSGRWRQRLIWFGAGLAFFLIIPALNRSPHLLLECFDVGQGDAILLRFPNGANLLVDCGEAGVAKRQLIPALQKRGVTHFNDFLITHYDDDHCGGAEEVLRSLRVDRLLVSSTDPTSDLGQAILKTARNLKIPVRKLTLGDTLGGFPGCKCLILWPVNSAHGDENAESIVLRISYGETDILLTGDISSEEEHPLESAGNYLRSEVLKVAHHGSKAASERDFIRIVQPEIALISCGEHNPYGHPHRRVLADLQDVGTRIYRTDQVGSVTLATNGEAVWSVK